VRITLLGIAIGLLPALGIARLLASLLFGVGATDPATFGSIALLLVSVALVACIFPARRALAVDPIQALRTE
jgi:ABC-type antimicrobial peptide transport system permease subunit